MYGSFQTSAKVADEVSCRIFALFKCILKGKLDILYEKHFCQHNNFKEKKMNQ